MPEDLPSTRLVLVRHGQSRATVDQVAGGMRGCQGLTDLGVRQAEALRDRLAATGELGRVTALLSSTLPRALETATVLAPALGHLAIATDPDLCEMNPGEGDGLTWREWGERYGGFDTLADPYRPLAPGGESFAVFQLRVGRTLARLVVEHDGGVVVAVCHGGVIDGSLRIGFGLAWHAGWRAIAEPANTSLTEWECSTEREPRQWRLVRYNDAAHLGISWSP
jgi:2,3-bisphosphoglycerate-dependent phosphoglycerate mutase